MGNYKGTLLAAIALITVGFVMSGAINGGPGNVAVANEGLPLGRTMDDDALRLQAPQALTNDVDMRHLDRFVRDFEAAKVLGKALFWDMAAGSDGQACASCHFHAGADNRVKNQLSPGLLSVMDPAPNKANRAAGEPTPNPDNTFGASDNEAYDFVAGPLAGLTASGNVAGPNYTLESDDFPFHQLSDPANRNSDVEFDMNDVVSSQGVFFTDFVSWQLGLIDNCNGVADPLFNVAGVNVRRVEPRNTPTTINAVFNHRNFWDGRANAFFNGIDPSGPRLYLNNPDAGIYEASGRRFNEIDKIKVLIKNGSLASQAVGPPLSAFEMSCSARTFPDLGRKMLRLRALSTQAVAADDSLLASYRDASGIGLRQTYSQLIRRAFHRQWWGYRGRIDGYTQMEQNFSLFWGLAVQLYESELVSDQTKFDAWAGGEDGALTNQEKLGLEVFMNKGKCYNCHVGPEFTGAAIRFRACQPDGNQEAIERMIMGDNGVATYDGGFYNVGVRPTFEDLGLGSGDLPFSRQVTDADIGLVDILPAGVELVGEVKGPDGLDIGPGDPLFCFDPCNFEVDLAGNPRFLPDGTDNPAFVCNPPMENERIAVDGAMKTSTIRNVELTAPFFHNGSESTLEDVVEFYDRGGNRRNANRDDCPDVDPDPNNVDNGDTSGFAENCSNVDPDIVRLNLLPEEEQALVAFMKALTDERVRLEQAPFDHPELRIPNGHPGDQIAVVDTDGDSVADDSFVTIPAVGAGGRAVAPNDFGDLLADPTKSP